MIGSLLADKYKILKKLGEGGMGSVYQAQQHPIDRMVAVKVLLGRLAQDEVAVKRFEQEARAVSRMQHPNTVTIFDYGRTEDDRLYIVMEYLRGKTLSDALRQAQGTGFEPKRAIHVARQVCASLHDAHAAGIIHRDLKPDNIFLMDMGGAKDFVKVLDFGVAKMADDGAASTLTQTGMIFGTPKYMSPEQAEGKPIDFRADIYAIGVVLYEMLVGRPPFLADTPVALLLKHISEPPPPFRKLRPDLVMAPEIEAVTLKALEKQPDNRYLTVGELSADLERCIVLSETGAVRVFEGSGSNPPQRIPTEVNPPATHLGALTPGGLRPPGAVPSGISFPVQDIRRLPTEPAPPPLTGASPLVPDDLALSGATGLQGVGAPPTGVTALPGSTALSTTRPIPVGSGIDALGGLRPPEPAPPSRVGLYAGVGAAILIVGVGVASLSGGSDVVPSKPITVSPSEAPDPVRRVTPEPTPSPSGASPAATPEATAAARPVETPGPRPGRNPVVAASPSPSAAPRADRVSIRFESTPPGAIVEDQDGRQLGVTPMAKEYLRSDSVERVRIARDGFAPTHQTFTLRADRTIAVQLEKEAAPQPVATPAATVAPSATPAVPRPTEVLTRRPVETKPPKPVIEEKVEDLK